MVVHCAAPYHPYLNAFIMQAYFAVGIKFAFRNFCLPFLASFRGILYPLSLALIPFIPPCVPFSLSLSLARENGITLAIFAHLDISAPIFVSRLQPN